MNFKKVILKMVCFYFDDIIKTEDFDFANILLDKKSFKNILVSGISHYTLIGAKQLRYMSKK